MNDGIEKGQKPIGTREWHDFIGQLPNLLPGLHMGGLEATQALLDMCQMEPTSRVLDIGCGSRYTASLNAKQYGARVHGIDLSEIMIAKAKERATREG